jgi:hypothetical protein
VVGLDLGDEKAPGISSGFKRFFDSAWHQR